jgi:PTH1 family peptidyl-tRNA hydrolase
MTDWKVVAGLGNPGPQYQNTRHNMGFMTLAQMAQDRGFENPVKFKKSLLTKGRVEGQKVLLVWPQTYMNLSGLAVEEVLSYYRLTVEDLLVIHDEMDLPLGRLKLTKGGGTAGHNGLGSLVEELSADFDRFRLGIGRPEKNAFYEGYYDYVLSPFNSLEIPLVDEVIERAAKATAIWVNEGLAAAQRLVNIKKPNASKKASEDLKDEKDFSE